MRLENKESRGYVVVKPLDARFDATKASELKDVIRKFVKSGKHAFLMNLSKLLYMDSRGLGVIISIKEMLEKENSYIVLCGAKGTVANTLRITRMEFIFKIFETEEDALREPATL